MIQISKGPIHLKELALTWEMSCRLPEVLARVVKNSSWCGGAPTYPDGSNISVRRRMAPQAPPSWPFTLSASWKKNCTIEVSLYTATNIVRIVLYGHSPTGAKCPQLPVVFWVSLKFWLNFFKKKLQNNLFNLYQIILFQYNFNLKLFFFYLFTNFDTLKF